MMRVHSAVLAAVATMPISSAAIGQILFSDDFDVDSSASWTVNQTTDASAMFAWDYSALGIPSAPNSGGTTLGLRFAANINSGTASAITASPTGQNFTGDYDLRFDAWINANGPFPGGGGGSTEFLTGGVGSDGMTVNGTSGSGGWFAVSGEGGSSRDYRGYKDAGEQFAESGQFFAGLSSAGGGAHNASDPYYAAFGGLAPPALQQASYPQQTGLTGAGTPAFAWREMLITVRSGVATWYMDGLPIAALDPAVGSSFSTDGNIAVGYADLFTSISDNADLSFGLVDNVVVVVPAPGALALLAGSGLFLIRRRR